MSVSVVADLRRTGCSCCANCQYFRAVSVNAGQCKVDPPKIVSGSGNFHGYFPLVDGSEWCGQFLHGEYVGEPVLQLVGETNLNPEEWD